MDDRSTAALVKDVVKPLLWVIHLNHAIRVDPVSRVIRSPSVVEASRGFRVTHDAFHVQIV